MDARTIQTRNRSRRQSKIGFTRCHLVLPFFKKLTRRLVKRESLSSLSEHFETGPLEHFEDDQEEQEKLILQINNTPRNRFGPICFETQRENSPERKESQEDQLTRPGKDWVTGDNRLRERARELAKGMSMGSTWKKERVFQHARTDEFRKPMRKINLEIEIPGENGHEKENQELYLENLELKKILLEMNEESAKMQNKLFLMSDQIKTLVEIVDEKQAVREK